MADRSKRPPGEALVDLRRRLALLSPRDPARSEVITRAAEAYGMSVWTIYRSLRELTRPKSVRRSDHGCELLPVWWTPRLGRFTRLEGADDAATVQS